MSAGGSTGRGQNRAASPGGEAAAVLLVEADSAGRQAMRELLVREGYYALEASSTDAASEILAHRDDIVVVIADLDLPGRITGAELVRLLVRQAPWLTVVATSADATAARPGVGFLSRPYSPEGMVEAVRAALSTLHHRRARRSPDAR
ncbi:response regulator [Phenylobacterium sp. LjRoot225]|uniref:response regulator n=1 Tax=Phenylobacterium sp. LjRoot225 TaxID=3342285 RepID=UPI003ECF1795